MKFILPILLSAGAIFVLDFNSPEQIAVLLTATCVFMIVLKLTSVVSEEEKEDAVNQVSSAWGASSNLSQPQKFSIGSYLYYMLAAPAAVVLTLVLTNAGVIGIGKYETQNIEFRREIAELNIELQTANGEVSRLNGELQTANAEVTRLNGELKMANDEDDAEIARLQDELDAANATITDLQQQLANVPEPVQVEGACSPMTFVRSYSVRGTDVTFNTFLCGDGSNSYMAWLGTSYRNATENSAPAKFAYKYGNSWIEGNLLIDGTIVLTSSHTLEQIILSQ